MARQALEQRGRQDDLVEHGGLALVLEEPPQHEYRIAGLQVERARDLGGRLAPTDVEQAARRMLVASVVAADAQEAEHRGSLFGVRRDEGALALPAHEQVVGGELVDRLAHRALRLRDSARRARSRSGSPRRASIRPPRAARSAPLICWYSGRNGRRRRAARACRDGRRCGSMSARRRSSPDGSRRCHISYKT